MQLSVDQQTDHIQWSDNAKGIGIILVVLGHGMFPVHSLIDSFHMPLFFILAGLFVNTDKYEIKDYVSKRFVRVLIPYFLFTLTVGLYALPMGWHEVVHHVSALWFLYTIFFASSLYYVIRKYLTVEWCNLLFASMLVVMPFISIILDGTGIWIIIERILYAVIFIHVGYIYNRFMTQLTHVGYVFWISILVFLFCNVLILNKYVSLDISYYSGTLFKLPVYVFLPVALSGSYLTMYISRKIVSSNILQYIGRNSLAIYALHIPLIWKLNNLISSLPHYNQITYKLLYALLEYCIVFAVVMTIIWTLQKN